VAVLRLTAGQLNQMRNRLFADQAAFNSNRLSNSEITAIPELLNLLELKGCLVSVEANVVLLVVFLKKYY
jgi:hypothetical protein